MLATGICVGESSSEQGAHLTSRLGAWFCLLPVCLVLLLVFASHCCDPIVEVLSATGL